MSKPAITIIQTFPYRSQPEEFSNKYYFTGSAPGDSASWKALADALIQALRPCFGTETSFVRAYGYTDGANPSIWSHDYTVPGPPVSGSMIPTSMNKAPGDTAAWIRWETAKRNSKGKVVYARKYFHDVHTDVAGDIDKVATVQNQAMAAFGVKCTDGTISSVFHLCLPDGTVATNPIASYWVTTRTLKRRGKRPPT